MELAGWFLGALSFVTVTLNEGNSTQLYFIVQLEQSSYLAPRWIHLCLFNVTFLLGVTCEFLDYKQLLMPISLLLNYLLWYTVRFTLAMARLAEARGFHWEKYYLFNYFLAMRWISLCLCDARGISKLRELRRKKEKKNSLPGARRYCWRARQVERRGDLKL